MRQSLPPGDEPARDADTAGDDAGGSITVWLGALKGGDTAALQPLWDRYFSRLVAMVRRRLCASGAGAAVNDDEDVALSVINALHDGVLAGRFPRLDDRDDLWRVLLHVARHKLVDRHRREQAQKNPRRRTHLEVDLAGPSTGDGGSPAPLEGFVGREPTPEEAAETAEAFRLRLASLGKPDLRRIAEMKLMGHTNQEIADVLGCSLRSVTLKLELIRKTWEAEGALP